MAENETLDLKHVNSARWRKLRQLITDGETDEKILTEAEQCLYRTFKNVCKLIPVDRLLSAAAGQNGEIYDIVKGCRMARDYAQLFEREANQGLDRQPIMENVVRATLDNFLDGTEIEAVPSQRWRSFSALNQFYRGLNQLFDETIHKLAQKIVQHPDKPPSLPPLSKEAKEERRRELNKMSLLGR